MFDKYGDGDADPIYDRAMKRLPIRLRFNFDTSGYSELIIREIDANFCWMPPLSETHRRRGRRVNQHYLTGRQTFI